MTVESGPDIVDTNIALHIDFANPKYISGNTVSDSSGNNYTVSVINAGSASATIANGYCTFAPAAQTGAATYFQITDAGLLTNYSELTVETVAYVTSDFSQGYGRIRPVSMRTSSTGLPCGFALGAGKYDVEMFGTGSGNPGQDINGYYVALNLSNSAVGLNKWVHVTQTVSATNNRFKTYINGNLDRTIINATTSNIWNGVMIGRGIYDITANFAGRVGFVKIYKSALSDAEVAKNFNALRGRYGI